MRRTISGWMIPLARIEAASSSSPSELKWVRGCMGFGCISPSGSVPDLARRAGAGADAPTAGAPGCPRAGKRGGRPLHSAWRGLSLALLIRQDLLRQFDIALGSP